MAPQHRTMDSHNGYLILIGGLFSAFIQTYMFIRGEWVLAGVWKVITSLLYGGVGAYGAYFTRKYIITHVEEHKGFWNWIRHVIKRKSDRGK